jgi:hypothetical protein
MGTNNFYSSGKTIFAVLMDYEDEVFDENGEPTGEKEMVAPDQDDSDNLKDWVKELFNEQTKFSFSEDGSFNNNRNFEGTLMGSLKAEKWFGDINVEVRVNLILRSGYYEGANLDYEVEYYAGSDYDDTINFSYEFESHSDMSKGLQVIQTKNAERWAEKIKEELTEEVEKIYTRVSTPYRKLGSFSNGEGVYEKI